MPQGFSWNSFLERKYTQTEIIRYGCMTGEKKGRGKTERYTDEGAFWSISVRTICL
jgi:hypothetical protein